MKSLAIPILLLSFIALEASELRVIPASPPLAEIAKQAGSAVIVLLCKPNASGDKLVVEAALKGQNEYKLIKNRIADFLPNSDKAALATDGYRELVFIVSDHGQNKFRTSKSIAMWPQRDETMGDQQFRFLAHALKDVERAIQNTNKEGEQGGGGNALEPPSHPSTAPTKTRATP